MDRFCSSLSGRRKHISAGEQILTQRCSPSNDDSPSNLVLPRLFLIVIFAASILQRVSKVNPVVPSLPRDGNQGNQWLFQFWFQVFQGKSQANLYYKVKARLVGTKSTCGWFHFFLSHYTAQSVFSYHTYIYHKLSQKKLSTASFKIFNANDHDLGFIVRM